MTTDSDPRATDGVDFVAPQGGNVIHDPNGWDPMEVDISEMADRAGVRLGDDTVLPMDHTLLRYAASRMEHEGGVGDETYDRTVQVYETILADADAQVAELAQALSDNDKSLSPDEARDQANAMIYSELTSRAARSLMERGGSI